MPIRSRVTWVGKNSLSDPRLLGFDSMVRNFRMRRKPPHWGGDKVWKNLWLDLPIRPFGYYREFYVGTSSESAELRVVLGRLGEVYVSGDHHHHWRQVIGMASSKCSW